MFNIQIENVGKPEISNGIDKYYATLDKNVSYVIDVNYGEGKTCMSPASSTNGNDGGLSILKIYLVLEKNINTYQSYISDGEIVLTDFALNYVMNNLNIPIGLHLEVL